MRNPPWALLAVLPVGAVLVSLLVGRYPVGPGEVLGGLWGTAPRTVTTLIREVRLPRALAAALVGMNLALAGAAFQGMFRNPLVDPRILGVSAGAAFGAALAIITGVPWYALDGVSFLLGLLAVGLVLGVTRRFGGSILVMVISGILVGSLFSALLGVLKYMADPLDELPAITYWLLGSLAGADWQAVVKLLPWTILGAGALVLFRWRLDLLSLEEREAASLGLNVRQLRTGLVAAGTLLVAAAVSQAGMIGWIGLITPHAARALVGPAHSRVLPASAALGAFTLVSLDMVSRSALASEIPLGVLTGLIGAPAFLLLFMRYLARGGGWG
ncbi:iron ABC transporter permease [Candidatus Bipolaricaulota bacterium]|nr:iron ABC transporter permease [Candidatus Bipolaricaulota bacterium]